MMIDTSLIPNSEYLRELQEQDGNTQDIMNVILKADQNNDTRFAAFAAQFAPTKEGLKELWKFTRYKIKYKTDAFGTQDIKLPAALWRAKQGDCKSKTLFINQVLKCLGIDYIIRFVSFDNGDYTHIYSIAILNGQYIPLDSVYEYFNKEAPYQNKKDYTMTQISTITGFKGIGEQDVQAAAKKRFEEIQQRKRYVTPEPPINFAKVSEGEALLQLLVRKLKILGTMNDEIKTISEQGINLVRSAIKTGSISTGIIPNELQGVAERANYYLKMTNPAIGHGIRGRKLDLLRIKALRENNFIGAQGMVCLASLWFLQHGGTGTVADPFIYNPVSGSAAFDCNSSNRDLSPVGNRTFFFYGRNLSRFRTSHSSSWADYNNIINVVIAQYPNLIRKVTNIPGDQTYSFANNGAYDFLMEELKQKMPVLSNWANDLYRADNTRPDGTVGTGLLYNFVPDVTQKLISAITPANFPAIVQTKMVFQQQYIDSCVNFSTISRSVFDDMAENGVLFDSGGESPQRLLSGLLQNYDPNISIAPGVLELIVTLAATILSSLPSIIDACNNGAKDAKTVDSSAADTAQFATQSSSTLPGNLDFLRPSNNNGNNNNSNGGGNNNSGSGSGSGNNNNNNGKKSGSLFPLLLGSAALVAVSKKKKQK